MPERLYFAYGSNINLDQMERRCPNAEVVCPVTLNGYRLLFRGSFPNNGVATIAPDPTKQVKGAFIHKINMVVIPRIRWHELNASYSEPGHAYAKQVLGEMHQAFERVYGNEAVTEERCGEYICLPAITRANNTGELCVALVQIDLSSSGEHWDTQFLTEQGILPHPDHFDSQTGGRVDRLVPYSYWYTPRVQGDIHVNFHNMPAEVAEVLKAARELPLVEPRTFDADESFAIPTHKKPHGQER